MKSFFKTIYLQLPLFCRIMILWFWENIFSVYSLIKEIKEYRIIKLINPNKKIKNILIFIPSGLYFAGTEKNLQIIANNLCTEYNIFFMYSSKISKDRINYMDKNVFLIDFDFSLIDIKHPYFIYNMNPHIKTIINKYKIDLIITAGDGYTKYPINTITNIPIIMLNIFGGPNLQKNIVKNLYVSKEVLKHTEKYIGVKKNTLILNNPISTFNFDFTEEIKFFKDERKLKEDAFIFGRIGRDDDKIHDNIAIEAFKLLSKEYSNVYYVIMSPPPILIKKVIEENISNIIFLVKSSKENDVWFFHNLIDCLAHFRYDGETFGVNIAESMYAGNPIISHKSKIWNAHLEYLSSDFSRIANIDNIKEYYIYMKEFLIMRDKHKELWKKMQENSKEYAENNFTTEIYMKKFKNILEEL